jgi:hypothetical protein
MVCCWRKDEWQEFGVANKQSFMGSLVKVLVKQPYGECAVKKIESVRGKARRRARWPKKWAAKYARTLVLSYNHRDITVICCLD